MNKISITSLVFTALFFHSMAQSMPTQTPNIVVIVADDMGWGDSSTYGHKIIKTPNLDKLAKQGVKFTQGYSAAGVCSPSRSAILTGRTPYRNGVWRHLSGADPAPAHLRKSEITYPKLFQIAGYETGHFGKWHLLSRYQFKNEQFPHPNDHGYDYWFATQNNAFPNHRNPVNFVRNGKPVGKLAGYSAPLVADEAIDWLTEKRDPTKPFLMSVWFHEPHAPIKTDIKFSELYPNESKKNKAYFGNVSQMDYALGQILDTLETQGVADNTFVVFTSDNGPVDRFGGSTGGLRGYKRDDFEGGIRVPFVIRWPGHIKANSQSDIPVIGTDIFTTVVNLGALNVPKDRTIDGVNLLPAIEGKKLTRQTPLFWRTHVSPVKSRVALREGDWKIVADETLTEFMLFNVEKERNESNDLAREMPEKLAHMKKLLIDTWQNISAEGPNHWWQDKEKGELGKGSQYIY